MLAIVSGNDKRICKVLCLQGLKKRRAEGGK